MKINKLNDCEEETSLFVSSFVGFPSASVTRNKLNSHLCEDKIYNYEIKKKKKNEH